MQIENRLRAVLQQHLPFHKRRVEFIALFVLALIKVRSVNCSEIAVALNVRSKFESNRRRIERFLSGFAFRPETLAHMVLALLPQDVKLTVSIDRTEWQFGTRWINILFAGLCINGTTYPFLWQMKTGKGCTSTGERIAMIRRIITLLPVSRIEALVADREFIGHDWFSWLQQSTIPFYIRIRKDTLVASGKRLVQVKRLFDDLKYNTARRIGHRRAVHGVRLWVTGMKIKDDYLIIASNRDDMKALDYYRQCWGIETMFACLKTRGFDLEATHLKSARRIEKLVGLISIAYLWASMVGVWATADEPIRLKAHGRKAYSIFRAGLDRIRALLIAGQSLSSNKTLRMSIELLRPKSRPQKSLRNRMITGAINT